MFKTNQQKETMTKIYMSDEDKMMKDKSIKWSQSSVINNDFKLDYQAIGDCYYDIYCQPQHTTKETLLKDMAKILNGELTAEDFRNEIKQWLNERSEECYLDNEKVRRYNES